MQLNNMGELITVAKHWRERRNHRRIVRVFNNENLNQVTCEQHIINGHPELEASQRIQYFLFALCRANWPQGQDD